MASLTIAFVLALILSTNAIPMELLPGLKAIIAADEAHMELPGSLASEVTEVNDEESDYSGLVDSYMSEAEWDDQRNICELCESLLNDDQEKGDVQNPVNNFILNPESGTKEQEKEMKVDDHFNDEKINLLHVTRYCSDAIAKCSLLG